MRTIGENGGGYSHMKRVKIYSFTDCNRLEENVNKSLRWLADDGLEFVDIEYSAAKSSQTLTVYTAMIIYQV
jgi:hypothetical protein